jgi:hypothetical protein
MVHVLPDEEKDDLTMRTTRICSANRMKKTTYVFSLTCGTLHKEKLPNSHTKI